MTEPIELNKTLVIFDYKNKEESELFETDFLMLFFRLFENILTDFPSKEVTINVMSLNTFRTIYDMCMSLIKNNDCVFYNAYKIQQACEFLLCDIYFHDSNDGEVDENTEVIATLNYEHCLEKHLIDIRGLHLLQIFYKCRKTKFISMELLKICYKINWKEGLDYFMENFEICWCGDVIKQKGSLETFEDLVKKY